MLSHFFLVQLSFLYMNDYWKNHNFDYTIGEGIGQPLQYSCLENSIDRGACQATVNGVTDS